MTTKMLAPVAILGLLLSSAGAARQQPSGAPIEQFTAIASNISEIARPGITSLDIDILRWTDPGEAERLMTALNEKGQQGLVDALQKAEPVGRMRTPGSLAYDFHYAQQTRAADGTRQITLLTDRPIGFFEAANRPRSIDYPFTFVEMKIDASGHGEGKLFLATKMTRTGNLLVIENFASQPIVLGQIRRRIP